MPQPPIRKDTIAHNTRVAMKNLGVYRPEYEPLILIFAELSEQYKRLTAEFVKSGYAYSEKTAEGGTKKAPIVATLETLRKDILQYSDRLCLNPRAMKDFDKEPEKVESELEKALKGLSGLG